MTAHASRGQRVPWDLAPEQDLSAHTVYWVTPGAASEDRSEEVRDRFLGVAGARDALMFVSLDRGEGVPGLRSLLSPTGAKLVILDPLQAVVGNLGSARARQSMENLVSLARETDSTVVAIIHTTKSGQVRGRGEIQDVVRSHLWIGPHPADERLKVLAQAPSSYGEGEPVPFVIDGTEEPPALVHIGDAEWDDDVDIVDLMPKPPKRRGTSRRQTARERAQRFLREVLSGGPVRVSEVEQRARRLRFSRSTLHRAAGELGLATTAQARAGDGTFAAVYWALPWNAEDPADSPPRAPDGGPEGPPPRPNRASTPSRESQTHLASDAPPPESEDHPSAARFRNLDLDEDASQAGGDRGDDGLPDAGVERFRFLDLD